MDQIIISDLEIFYSVGVTGEERSRPQRLLLTVELFTDFSAAAATDDLGRTLDYFAITQRLLHLGEGRSWKLIESLASEIAGLLLAEFKPAKVSVEVKKFIIAQARYVSVRLQRPWRLWLRSDERSHVLSAGLQGAGSRSELLGGGLRG